MNCCRFYILICCTLLFGLMASAQTPVKELSAQDYDSLLYSKFGKNKKIPNEIAPQVLIALSFYPELKDKKIVFRLRNKKTPLTSRPTVGGIFRGKKNRKYVITISKKIESSYSAIHFDKLPFNAQIGVLGHELGHISEYNTLNGWQVIGLGFKMFRSTYVDEFEFNTDRICIQHGLGHQLLAWSTFVRQALKLSIWRGAQTKTENSSQERYMNPETIVQFMQDDSQY